MEESLSMLLVQRIAIIAVIAYVFSNTKAFGFLWKERTTIQEKVVLISFFFVSIDIGHISRCLY